MKPRDEQKPGIPWPIYNSPTAFLQLVLVLKADQNERCPVPQFDTFAVINFYYDSGWCYQKPQQITPAHHGSCCVAEDESMKLKRGTKTFSWYLKGRASDFCSIIGCFVLLVAKTNWRLRTHRIFRSFFFFFFVLWKYHMLASYTPGFKGLVHF